MDCLVEGICIGGKDPVSLFGRADIQGKQLIVEGARGMRDWVESGVHVVYSFFLKAEVDFLRDMWRSVRRRQ